jgi:membrane protein required for colicin V production
MTVLDYFVLIVVIASVASGVTRGILKGIISIVSAVVGLLAAAQFYDYSAILFRSFVSTERDARMLGFVAIFLGVLLAGGLLARWLRRGMKRVRLNWVDRVMGGAFGAARGWLICSVIYLALTAFPVKLEAVERASFAPVLLEGTRMISYLTSPELRQQFLRGYEMIQELWREKE